MAFWRLHHTAAGGEVDVLSGGAPAAPPPSDARDAHGVVGHGRAGPSGRRTCSRDVWEARRGRWTGVLGTGYGVHQIGNTSVLYVPCGRPRLERRITPREAGVLEEDAVGGGTETSWRCLARQTQPGAADEGGCPPSPAVANSMRSARRPPQKTPSGSAVRGDGGAPYRRPRAAHAAEGGDEAARHEPNRCSDQRPGRAE